MKNAPKTPPKGGKGKATTPTSKKKKEDALKLKGQQTIEKFFIKSPVQNAKPGTSKGDASPSKPKKDETSAKKAEPKKPVAAAKKVSNGVTAKKIKNAKPVKTTARPVKATVKPVKPTATKKKTTTKRKAPESGSKNGSAKKKSNSDDEPVVIEPITRSSRATPTKKSEPPAKSPLRIDDAEMTVLIKVEPDDDIIEETVIERESPRKLRKSPTKGKKSKGPSMVTIHQQDLIEMIKTEVEIDDESDPEIQVSSILADKSNPIGMDGIEVVQEIRIVQIVLDQQNPGQSGLSEEAQKNPAKHTCTICQNEFGSKKELNVHVNVEHSDRSLFKCCFCKTSFLTGGMMKAHQAKALSCNECKGKDKKKKKFCSAYALNKHKNMHSKTIYRCFICDKTFPHPRDLRSHEETHKTDDTNRVHSCQTCGKLFVNVLSATACNRMHLGKQQCQICQMVCRTPAELRRHVNTHDSSRKFQCAMCPSVLKSEFSLKIHVKHMHERTQEKEIECKFEGCTKKFFHAKQQKQHERICHSPKTVKCLHCDRLFTSQATMNKHINNTHDKSENRKLESATCEICGKELASKYYLKIHMTSHTDVKEFACDQCGKTFNRKWVMETHKKSIHMGDESRTYACQNCTSSFVSLGQLNFHQKMVHEMESDERLPCPIKGCQHAAKSKAQLDAHLKSVKHSVDRQFKCPHCSMSFNRKWTMEEHVLRRHEDVRRQYMYKCLLCGRGFYFKKSYVTHTQIKHYQSCEYCTLTFTTTRYHMDHRRLVHGIIDPLETMVKFEPCHICGKHVGSKKKLMTHIFRVHSEKASSFYPGPVGTFEENNDDPEVIINFKKNKLKKEKAAKMKKRQKKAKKSDLKKSEPKTETILGN